MSRASDYLTKVLSETTEDVERCAARFLLRSLGYDKPQGKTDRGGRWYPSDEEQSETMMQCRIPSANWPWSYYKHAYTFKHMLFRYGVADRARDVRNLMHLYRLEEPALGAELKEKGVRI